MLLRSDGPSARRAREPPAPESEANPPTDGRSLRRSPRARRWLRPLASRRPRRCRRAKRAARLPAPRALFLLGTGLGALAGELASVARASLQEVPGVPPSWRELEVVAGELGELAVWVIVDAPGPSELGTTLDASEPAWTRGFPCWPRARGADVRVHTSAGTSLRARRRARAAGRELALITDHEPIRRPPRTRPTRPGRSSMSRARTTEARRPR